ncbi:MAG TPA: hypothetical protein VG710_00340 [Opitutus sp.]|nr:hypothetical protein [Opitutus sp.]
MVIAFALFARAASAAASPVDAASPVINVCELGASGDGRFHSVKEWIADGRYRSFHALRKDCPFIDGAGWSTDEAAFARAKLLLPASGGTIHFPAGQYLAVHSSWKIMRDNVRLTGDGAERTILSTGPDVADALVIAPYRHVGWIEGSRREFPFTDDSGRRGDDGVQLKSAEWAAEFRPGELVFIRDGANRFDQDYGEFNEVASSDAAGRLVFKHPLARDYTLAALNWAGEVAEDFRLPREGRTVRIRTRSGPGFFIPPRGTTVTIDGDIFHVESAGPNTLRLSNPGRGNAPAGTVVHAGAKIGKSRSVIRVTKTVRNFRCEDLQVVGRRKILNLSNSYDLAFVRCAFVRDARDRRFEGGLTIDGDDGRFARFEQCRIAAMPPAQMQFARSFGGVVFDRCEFIDAGVAFTEFNFDCEVKDCRFDVHGNAALTSVIVAGKSCGDLRFFDNRIKATGVRAIFDSQSDIQSQKHGGDGPIVVGRNTVDTVGNVRFYYPTRQRFSVEANQDRNR